MVILIPFYYSYAQITGIITNETTSAMNNSGITLPTNDVHSPKIKQCLNLMNPVMMTINVYNNIKGSIKLDNIGNLIPKLNTSLSQASTTAEQAIGINSKAIEAYLCGTNGSLVYMIWVINDSSTNPVDVIMDHANDQILLKNSNLFQ